MIAWLPHLRGVLILLHVVAITLMALPAPGEGMNRSAWQDPTVQGEFAAWSERLSQCGLIQSPPELEERVWQLAMAYTAVRDKVLEPFQEYYATCGTVQSWRMFAGPHRYPERLVIDVEEAGRWCPAYVQRDPRHDWLAGTLDQYRVRPVIYRFGWYRYGGRDPDYDRFVHWVAGQTARDFPQATRVRVRLYQQRTPAPAEVRAGVPVEGEFVTDDVADLSRDRS